MNDKFEKLIDRLSQKIRLSANPVPGFIVGLSGTDSIVTFILLYEALKRYNREDRLYGIHYVNEYRKKPSWFEKDIIPWLAETYPNTRLEVHTPLGGNFDQQRWADLHLRALNEIVVNGFGEKKLKLFDPGQNYWVSGCMNATEKALGNYSILSNSVSIQPIQTIYKGEILDICVEHNVPEIAIEMSQIPDCFCGREEIAAHNVRLIDEIITYKLDPSKYDPELLAEVYAYVQETKRANDFKNRTPFNV
ncbi:MAG: hypothetical protein M0R77_20665 [Gammaproteobacteria bacterium]|nr:hypothetical protein [Gammaproteobacteria bacterium]